LSWRPACRRARDLGDVDGTGIASEVAREHVEPFVRALLVELGEARDGRRVRAVRARLDVEVEPDRDAEQRRRDDPGKPD
jgi:hypothetical protein